MTAALIFATVLSAATTGAQAGAAPAYAYLCAAEDPRSPEQSQVCIALDAPTATIRGDAGYTPLAEYLRIVVHTCVDAQRTHHVDARHFDLATCIEHDVITGEDLP